MDEWDSQRPPDEPGDSEGGQPGTEAFGLSRWRRFWNEGGKARRWVKWSLCGAAALGAVLGITLVCQVYIWPPDFAELRTSVEMPIRLADGTPSVRRVGPAAPGWVPYR